ncbi:MAG TPA: chemotaxis protein CheB [Burkholderiales bacterium]
MNRPRTRTAARPLKKAAAPEAAVAQAPPPAAPVFPVVAFGASAGGLEALTQLFSHLPGDTGMAFVVIQHLDPTHRSMLRELLSKATPMPAVEVKEGMEVLPDHVYVIPPNAHMAIANGRLRLLERGDGRGSHMPIDAFFRSLSEERGALAIGVILSGAASDGTLGLRAIKDAGGVTFAQDRESAKYDSMPVSAVAAGGVDFVLPPEQIGKELEHLSRHPFVTAAGETTLPPATEDAALNEIFVLVRRAIGVDFTYYKHTTILRRIQRRMMLLHVDKLSDYAVYLRNHADEIPILYGDILINVSSFFRDPEWYEGLTTEVLPDLLSNRVPGSPLRAWVAGCAAGEEAYSLAITISDYFTATGNSVPVQLFATDISEAVIEKARAGIYSDSAVQAVHADRLRRYFVKVDGGYQVAKSLRDMCLFARQDLTRDPPFSKLDLISCRNVLIYLGPVLQKRIIPAFHYALKPDGYLVLGNSETVGAYADLFELVDKKGKIYRRKVAASRPFLDTLAPHPIEPPVHAAEPAEAIPPQFNVDKETDRLLLGRYAPPGVVIDENMDVIQFRGQTGPLLEPSPGGASLNLLRLVREELRPELRRLVAKAYTDGVALRRDGVHLRGSAGGNGQVVNLVAIPMLPTHSKQPRHCVVLFEATGNPRPAGAKDVTAAKSKGKARKSEHPETARLRQELTATREYLQAVIEEQEASNEELQSANEEHQSHNEELQSINEELETAKEELQSSNEELTTLNEELQNRNLELALANNDLKNLLDSIDIAVVMLDRDLRLRRYTPPAAKVLNLIPGDLGRPIGDLRPNVIAPDLEQLLRSAVDDLSFVQKEVQDREGRRYELRVRPYRTAENRIDGAVLTVIEIGPPAA